VYTGVIGQPPGWVFEYRTRIPISDRDRLEQEVAALWPEIQGEADAAEVTRASIWPNNFSRQLKLDGWRPVVLSHHSTAFSFEKGSTGTWLKRGGWSMARRDR
jgi:hypothetical protein